jgi:gp16 family phage-associated protein
MKTIETVRAEMTRRGETAAGWARKHAVSAETVRGVLLGRIKGRSGEAHKVAVLLGIKEGQIVEEAGDERH